MTLIPTWSLGESRFYTGTGPIIEDIWSLGENVILQYYAGNLRNTQTAVEVHRDGAPNVRETQCTIEVLRDMTPVAYNTQCTLEVLRSNLLPAFPYYYQQIRRR